MQAKAKAVFKQLIQIDEKGLYIRDSGLALPADGRSGYARGCDFFLTNTSGAVVEVYRNQGSSQSCKFGGWKIIAAATVALATGVTAPVIPEQRVFGSDVAIGQYATSDDSDQIQRLAAGCGNIVGKFTDPLSAHSLSYFVARNNPGAGMPEYAIVTGGKFTTAGGDAAETITVAGITADDIAVVHLQTKGASPVLVVEALAVAGQIDVTMSADPGTDHILSYCVLRPAGNGVTPSHRIAYAGTVAATTGSATQAKTVTGVLATDIAFGGYDSTDDTDTVVTVAPTANTVTFVLSADPLSAHVLNYVVLRAL